MWGIEAEIQLNADNDFKNFTIGLKTGDKIWFQGYLLSEGLGGPRPGVRLEQIGCLGCHKTDLASQRKSPTFSLSFPSIGEIVQAALKSALGFFLGPIIRFT
jgi:hypothetical protein